MSDVHFRLDRVKFRRSSRGLHELMLLVWPSRLHAHHKVYEDSATP